MSPHVRRTALIAALGLTLAACGGSTPADNAGAPGESPAAEGAAQLTEADLPDTCVRQDEVPEGLEPDTQRTGPNSVQDLYGDAKLTVPKAVAEGFVAGYLVVYEDPMPEPTEVPATVVCSVHVFESAEVAAEAFRTLAEGNRPRVEAGGGVQEAFDGLGEEAVIQRGATPLAKAVTFLWRTGSVVMIAGEISTEVTIERARALADQVNGRVA